VLHSRTFTSLQRHRNYRLYFSGQFVSQAGSWLQSAAQAWLILQLTHSAAAVGVLAFWQFGPYAIFGLFGGPIADRLDHRKSLIWTQTALMLCAAILAVISLLNIATVWAIDAIAAVRGLVLVLNNPSRQAFIVQMVGRDELPNAIALNSSVANATRVLGPGIGGILIASLGVGICFAINAASYVAVILALMVMREEEFYPIEGRGAKLPLLSSLREGLDFAWHTRRIFVVLAVLLVVSTFGINFNVLLPVLASQTLHSGPEVFGLITACFGGGALVGALISASIGRSTWPILLGSGTAFGLFEMVLAPQHTVLACIVILLLVGVSYTLYTSNSNAMVQLASPGNLQGRVTALYSYIFTGSSPIGALVAGGLSQAGGTQLAFLITGGVSMAAALAGIAYVFPRFLQQKAVVEVSEQQQRSRTPSG
jgi:MFS family permease